MKKLLLLILLSAQFSLGQEYAIARSHIGSMEFWELENNTMPVSIWTNSMLWLLGDSPIINYGATNASYPCYARTCASSGLQTDITNQPERVLDGALWGYKLNGTNTYLIITNSALISPANEITMYAKFKSTGANPTPFFFDKKYSSSFYMQLVSLTKRIEFGGNTGAGSYFTTPIGSYSTGAVVTAVVTLNTVTDTAKCYVNGVEIFTTNVFTGAIGSNTNWLYIGVTQPPTSNTYFTGWIYEAAIFDRELSSNEVVLISQ